MTYVLDTHPLVWFLENNRRLSPPAAEAIARDDAALVVPSIVLAEVWYLYHHKRIRTRPEDVQASILSASNCAVYPLDEAVLQLLPPGLDIHDGIIVATALLYRDVLHQPVQLITADHDIHESRIVQVLW